MGDEADRIVDSLYDYDDYWPSGLDFEDDDGPTRFRLPDRLEKGIKGMELAQDIIGARISWRMKHEEV